MFMESGRHFANTLSAAIEEQKDAQGLDKRDVGTTELQHQGLAARHKSQTPTLLV